MEKQEWLTRKLSKAERIGVLNRYKKNIEHQIKWSESLGEFASYTSLYNVIENMNSEELSKYRKAISLKIKQDFLLKENIGNIVFFIYKGQIFSGTIAKINNKTFSVDFVYKGFSINRNILFDLYKGSLLKEEVI